MKTDAGSFSETLALATISTASHAQGAVTLTAELVITSNIAMPVCSENQAHPQNLRVKLWYDMMWYGIIYDMIWYDMIRYDMIYDMIWYDVIWYYMIYMIWYTIWYDMIWYDMIWYMIWYDMIWYDMIWYDIWCDVIWYDILYIWCDIWWYDIFNCNWVATRWQ